MDRNLPDSLLQNGYFAKHFTILLKITNQCLCGNLKLVMEILSFSIETNILETDLI